MGALPRWVTRSILWCVWSTALAPVTGQFLLVTRTVYTRVPWCRQSSQNTGYSLRLLGEPMPRFSRPTITGPHLGVPAAIWRGVLERFRTYLQPGFEYPMQH